MVYYVKIKLLTHAFREMAKLEVRAIERWRMSLFQRSDCLTDTFIHTAKVVQQ